MVSDLKEANKELRLGNYAGAIRIYRHLLDTLPIPRPLIQFNLEMARRRAERKGIVLSEVQDVCASSRWTSHENLQGETHLSRIVLGGVVIGYPKVGSKKMPEQIVECIELYKNVSQIQDLHGLCLFLNGKAIKFKTASASIPIKVHAFGNQDIRLGSIWYSNTRDLRVSIEKEPSFRSPQVFRAYQYEPLVGGGLVLVGECFLEGKHWQLTDLALVNPYLPVLLTLSESDGVLADAALIPYPSLLHGGIHEHECYVDEIDGINTPATLAYEYLKEHLLALNDGWALGQIQVDVRDLIGTELIISSELRQWLWSIFSLRIKPILPPDISANLSEYWQGVFATQPIARTAEKFNRQSVREGKGRSLLCTAHAIPSLRALTACLSSGTLEQICGVSEFILVTKGARTHRWRLTWPKTALAAQRVLLPKEVFPVPMVLLGKDDITEITYKKSIGVSAIVSHETNFEASILDPLQLIMPVATDNVEISGAKRSLFEVDLVVTAVDFSAELFSAFLESLILQVDVVLRQIIVMLPPFERREAFEECLQRNFFDRYLLLSGREGEPYRDRVNRAAESITQMPSEGYILFVNQPMILHDLRTIETLAITLNAPKAVTSSPLLIGNSLKKSKPETVIRSGGVYPVMGYGSKEIEWRYENLVSLLPKTVFPVASHGDPIFMIKAKDWKKSGGFSGIGTPDEYAACEFSAKLATNNKLHLLVTHVSVEMHDRPPSEPVKFRWSPPNTLKNSSSALRIEELSS